MEDRDDVSEKKVWYINSLHKKFILKLSKQRRTEGESHLKHTLLVSGFKEPNAASQKKRGCYHQARLYTQVLQRVCTYQNGLICPSHAPIAKDPLPLLRLRTSSVIIAPGGATIVFFLIATNKVLASKVFGINPTCGVMQVRTWPRCCKNRIIFFYVQIR